MHKNEPKNQQLNTQKTMYFDHCRTTQECKEHYRTLAKKLHPDKQGGSNEAFVAMQHDYCHRLKQLRVQAPSQSKEADELACAILHITKTMYPHIYEAARIVAAVPTFTMLATMLGQAYPEHKETITDILELIANPKNS
ncbi:MAG: J domain-containing protein [Bacteroidales bacterium]|nr:J domain-containing protein [Bacteroidales bacterium]